MARKKATEIVTEETVEAMDAAQPAAAVAETVAAIEQTKAATSKNGKHSDRYRSAAMHVDTRTLYPLADAIALAKQTATTKFTGSIEAHFVVAQKGMRGFVAFPHQTGKQVKALVFGEVPASDTVLIGNDETIGKIASNALVPGKDFTVVIATPAYMPKLARIAKILGPKGLMPNPKSGTLTDKPQQAIKDLLGGQVEYKTEQNAPLVHIMIGKANAETQALTENINALISTIGQNKIKQLSLNATMGPGIHVKLT